MCEHACVCRGSYIHLYMLIHVLLYTYRYLSLYIFLYSVNTSDLYFNILLRNDAGVGRGEPAHVPGRGR